MSRFHRLSKIWNLLFIPALTQLKLKVKSVVVNFKGTCLYGCVGPDKLTAQYEFGVLPSYSDFTVCIGQLGEYC